MWSLQIPTVLLMSREEEQHDSENRGFFVAHFCLEKQCSGLFRYFFVVFSWLFRGFFVAPVLGKFYAYLPWNLSDPNRSDFEITNR